MFFKIGTEISGEVELLVKAKAIHLDRTIGCDPELIIRLGESDGTVGRAWDRWSFLRTSKGSSV